MPPQFTHIYRHSPHSSSGAAGSSEGTPDTRFTAFSPDDAQRIKVTGQAGTPLTNSQQDPFVTSANTKTGQKLSATASDFKPYSRNVGNTEVFDFASSATAALPRMADNLRALIGQMPGYGAQGSKAAQSSPVKATPQGSINQVGTFSTDTNATRCSRGDIGVSTRQQQHRDDHDREQDDIVHSRLEAERESGRFRQCFGAEDRTQKNRIG